MASHSRSSSPSEPYNTPPSTRAHSPPAEPSNVADSADEPSLLRLSPDEEAPLIAESLELKAAATKQFAAGDCMTALDGYIRALVPLPTYLSYDLAVLHANIAACHIRLERWKEAIEAATKSLEELETVDPTPKPESSPETGDQGSARTSPAAPKQEEPANAVFEITDELEERLEILKSRGQTLEDVQKLRIKALLRRAKARCELGSWAELQGALEDYTQLSRKSNLTSTDAKTVQNALKTVPGRLDERKQEEVQEMMGKLKGLGNGILKPFGLSTDNFQFVKDENTGGYSMNFNR